MGGLAAFEETMTCPYDPTHQIIPARFGFHLVRCRKQHLHANLQICPFNSTHHLPMNEYDLHVSECPDRATVERERYSMRSAEEDMGRSGGGGACGSSSSSAPPHHHHYENPEAECWDDLPEVPSYDPLANARTRNVLINPHGMTKAQRRQHRADEAVRLTAIQAEEARVREEKERARAEGREEQQGEGGGGGEPQKNDDSVPRGQLRRPTLVETMPSSSSVDAKPPQVQQQPPSAKQPPPPSKSGASAMVSSTSAGFSAATCASALPEPSGYSASICGDFGGARSLNGSLFESSLGRFGKGRGSIKLQQPKTDDEDDEDKLGGGGGSRFRPGSTAAPRGKSPLVRDRFRDFSDDEETNQEDLDNTFFSTAPTPSPSPVPFGFRNVERALPPSAPLRRPLVVDVVGGGEVVRPPPSDHSDASSLKVGVGRGKVSGPAWFLRKKEMMAMGKGPGGEHDRPGRPM